MKTEIVKVLNEVCPIAVHEGMLERPVHAHMGDLALPCFPFAKELRKPPAVIAQELAGQIQNPLVERTEAVNGYLNIFLNRIEMTKNLIDHILTKGAAYGSTNVGNGGTVTIDLSSPNIAKPFSMGHLRSTVLGNSISLILEKSGYEPIKINYIGDWGTQFGKLLTAYHKWGNEDEVKKAPIQTLLAYYIKFHEEAEKDEALNDEGRAAFKALEDGDPEAIRLWTWFRSESLKEFQRIYDLLGVSFDSFNGEAYYNDKMEPVVEELERKNLLKESEGALVVEMEEGTPPCLIKKSDGATLYATRDLAAAIDRQEKYRFVKSLYVVGNEQSLHFTQLKSVLAKLGYDWSDRIEHISFGLILKEGKKMSTRKGKIVLLEEVLNEAISLAEAAIEEKNPALSDKREVAEAVGVGAIIFSDLKQHRKHDIEFNLESMLQTEGETGPYVQYAYARANSVLRKAGETGSYEVEAVNDYEWEMVKELNRFPDIVKRAGDEFDPSIVAKFAIDLAQAFNSFYANVHVMTDEKNIAYRTKLIQAVSTVLKECLRLLGMKAPEEM